MALTVFQQNDKEIRLADKAGFCFGVKNAVERADALLTECRERGETVCATGHLIHNRTVIAELAEKGLRTVAFPEEAEPGSRILIRAHGEAASFHARCEKAGLRIEDMTCPFVARIHSIVKEAHESGKGVLIVGDVSHPEVIGIRGWAGEPCVVIGSEAEAEAFCRGLAQTDESAEPSADGKAKSDPECGEERPPREWVCVSPTTFIE